MSKIKITKEQADFIETFDGDKVKAVHYISRWGWGHLLSDGKGNEYNSISSSPIKINEKLTIINAVINGYEVKEEKVVLYIGFYDSGREEDRKIYFGAGINVTNKEIATEYDLTVEWEAKKVEALKEKGWEVEGVE